MFKPSLNIEGPGVLGAEACVMCDEPKLGMIWLKCETPTVFGTLFRRLISQKLASLFCSSQHPKNKI
jgi:hypothetical protein